MVLGTLLAWTPVAWVPVHSVFGSSFTVYNGVTAFVANVLVAAVLSATVAKHGTGMRRAAEELCRPTGTQLAK